MSVAHVDLLAPELEAQASPRARSRVVFALGCVAVFALAAVPAAVSVLLLTRPDLFLAH
jgi:hypothetical protein